jgi:adenosylmethionine-8-amino-7-oxononanoate aminotransferase
MIWHPYTHAKLDPPPIKIARAEGVYLYSEDGRRFLDAISSWWVNLHGHGHPAIAAAIADQARKLEHVIFAGFTHEPAEELASRLSTVLPASLSHIFFSDNGSTAVEVALKIAVQYWRNTGMPQKRRIIALEHAYHGDTVGAMAVSADSVFTDAFRKLMFPVRRAHSAYCHRCPVGKRRCECDIDCVLHLENLLERYDSEIAAVIVEPLLQGAGGMIVHPVEFLERVRDRCKQHNVLLIADEVLTGFGRTGQMFACELANVIPDLMCLSKGLTGGFLPLGATACGAHIYEAFSGRDRALTFFHGHSYSGNPLACAAANASLRVFETEPVFERIEKITRGHEKRLPFFQRHPAIADVRTLGTLAALELKAGDAGYLSSLRGFLYQFFLSRGILLRPLGNVLYLLPPYVITENELDAVYDALECVLDCLPNQ